MTDTQKDDDYLSLGILPVLPLRDMVVFPNLQVSLLVGRAKSVSAVLAAQAHGDHFLAVAQDDDREDADIDCMYRVGVVCRIIKIDREDENVVRVMVSSLMRVEIEDFITPKELDKVPLVETENFIILEDDEAPSDKPVFARFKPAKVEMQMPKRSQSAWRRKLLQRFSDYVINNLKNARDTLVFAEKLTELDELCYYIAMRLDAANDIKQPLLEQSTIQDLCKATYDEIQAQIIAAQVDEEISAAARRQMEQNQREYYLNEKLKAVKNELSFLDEAIEDDDDLLWQKLESAKLPKDVLKKAESEFRKLKLMPANSSESAVVRGYLEWIGDVPWNKSSKTKSDLSYAKQVLDTDHYGLQDVKDRILEYLAVGARVKKIKGPILCLVGPPGVGKTSLGESIARATGRKFVRMALGGVRDEAEIRGHRRTYIGAMPGKIVQSLAKVESNNPLFLLDEIDKMAQDYRGDPASAMLEVLDPAQNKAFSDHYLDLDLDLSQVLFVCTANSLDMPQPLLDRMEIIRLSGYAEDEKLAIAKNYLLPKAIKDNGLKDGELMVDDSAILAIIRHHTREAGVRNLEREINKICRKAVRKLVETPKPKKGKKNAPILVNDANLDDYLGVRPYDFGLAEKDDEIGRVTGLAWTSVGGELLTIETVSYQGKGELSFTGSLGDVMKESIRAAMSVAKASADRFGISIDDIKSQDIHVHIPEGATPKDGPSAGIALTTALVSTLTKIGIRADIAMTGEVTLRGKVLRIGGLKEKLLAAHRGGIKQVLIPKDNVRDLAEIPDNIKDGLIITAVEHIDEVLTHALIAPLAPLHKNATAPMLERAT